MSTPFSKIIEAKKGTDLRWPVAGHLLGYLARDRNGPRNVYCNGCDIRAFPYRHLRRFFLRRFFQSIMNPAHRLLDTPFLALVPISFFHSYSGRRSQREAYRSLRSAPSPTWAPSPG